MRGLLRTCSMFTKSVRNGVHSLRCLNEKMDERIGAQSATQDSKKRRQEYRREWMRRWRTQNKKAKIVCGGTSSEEDTSTEEITGNLTMEGQQSTQNTDREKKKEKLHQAAKDTDDISDNILTSADSLEEEGGAQANVSSLEMMPMAERDLTCDDDESLLYSSETDTVEDTKQTFSSVLASWVVECNIPHISVDKLLKALRENGHCSLPLTARTLLKTPTTTSVIKKSGMDYIYFNLGEELIWLLEAYPEDVLSNVDTLEISLNVDGLPLFRSSSRGVWPILGAIVNLYPVKVSTVALCCGSSKPSDLDFLNDTVHDLKILLNDGLNYGGKFFSIKLRAVICDAPAKALVKAVRQYSSYTGCDKCSQKGTWVGKMTFQQTRDLPLRTNMTFRNQNQEEHHNGMSPFCDLPIDMITAFPIDYMHQVCLGVMKRLIVTWMRDKKLGVRMSANQIAEINRNLLDLRRSIPDVFARKPRSLAEVDRFRATEYRQFLLYTGKIVLKGILPEVQYKHILKLNIAMSLLLSPTKAKENAPFAHELLVSFVENGREIYGKEFLVYNVHTLLHLADEVAVHGCLHGISAFPFENFMKILKSKVHSGKSPLVQIARRLREEKQVQPMKIISDTRKISMKSPNNVFILENLQLCEVVSIRNENTYNCRVYSSSRPLFSSPCTSFKIECALTTQKNSSMKVIPTASLTKQGIMVSQGKDKLIFMSITHEF